MEDAVRRKKQAQQPISKRQIKSADHDKWEQNRMYVGGAIKHRAAQNDDILDELDMEEERVMIMVHDIKPPFLDGRIVFTK